MSEIIVTVTGPSCSGKTTLISRLLATKEFTEVISTTTRPQRIGEVNGGTYHFVDKEEFDNIDMLERIHFNGNWYGGSVAEFEKQFASGLIPIIIVEPNGMEQINKNAIIKNWKVINVFVGCPTGLQAERFILRFFEETKAVLLSDKALDQAKLLQEYVNRMVSMQTTEAEWHKMFMNEVYASDSDTLQWLYFGKFDKQVETEVMGSILAGVHNFK